MTLANDRHEAIQKLKTTISQSGDRNVIQAVGNEFMELISSGFFVGHLTESELSNVLSEISALLDAAGERIDAAEHAANNAHRAAALAKLDTSYYGTDPHEAIRRYRALINNIPERTQFTQKFVDERKLVQKRIGNFADLIDGGLFDGLSPEEDKRYGAEIAELTAIGKRKQEQQDNDVRAADAKLKRRTVWDILLFRRVTRF